MCCTLMCVPHLLDLRLKDETTVGLFTYSFLLVVIAIRKQNLSQIRSYMNSEVQLVLDIYLWERANLTYHYIFKSDFLFVVNALETPFWPK